MGIKVNFVIVGVVVMNIVEMNEVFVIGEVIGEFFLYLQLEILNDFFNIVIWIYFVLVNVYQFGDVVVENVEIIIVIDRVECVEKSRVVFQGESNSLQISDGNSKVCVCKY